MGFDVILYSLIALGFIIFGLISYARWNFGSLEKLGIPVVKPNDFLRGSALLTYQKPGGLLDIEHMKKYGSIFGIYNGREPQIVICDPELIRLVTTKDAAEYFNKKRTLDFGDELFNESLEFQESYGKWKLLREMLSSAINSSSRIKKAVPAMIDTINDFVEKIKKEIKENGTNGKLEKYCCNEGIYGMLTDLVARSQFSIRIGDSDLSNRFVQNVRTLLSNPGAEAPWLASFVYAFPFLSKVLPNTMINPEPIKEFCVILRQLVDARRKERESMEIDFVDNLVEWHDQLGCPEFKEHNIFDTTIWSLGLQMFIGGQDQISLILAVLLFYASQNPEIEKKLQEEVDKVFLNSPDEKVLDHESLSELTYTTACINEAARLYPFFYRTERVCTKNWECEEKGLKIKKGTVVIIAIWATNRNPEYFEHPEDFKPDRFMPGNKTKIHPYSFSSFGFGPRNCPGKALSMEMMKLLIAYLVKNFRFIKRNDSNIKFVPAGPFYGAHEPFYFDVELRSPK